MKAWTEAGVQGITIMVSSGFKRMTESNALRDDLPLIFNLEDILAHEEKTNRTLFSVVHDTATVDKVVQVTEKLVGNLNLPNTGILIVLPVAQAYGMERIYD